MTVLSDFKKFFKNTKKQIRKQSSNNAETKTANKNKKTASLKSRKTNISKSSYKIVRPVTSDNTKDKLKQKTSIKKAQIVPQTAVSVLNPVLPKENPINTQAKPNKKSKKNKSQKNTDEVTLKISGTDNKTVFLHFLSNCDNLKQAIKKSGVSLSIVHYLLKTDPEFTTAVDEVLNKKLEFAAIDTALGGNSSLLTLMLTNRMSDKYKTKNSPEETPPYSRIIYVDAENIKSENEKGKKNERN